MAQGTVVYFRDSPAFETPGPKIENRWAWLVVPATDVYSRSDAARSGRDFLSETSGGTVTEANVTFARVGTRVGDSVWTSAVLDATDRDNLNTIVGITTYGQTSTTQSPMVWCPYSRRQCRRRGCISVRNL